MTTRRLRPRPAVTVRPSFVSQETSFAVLGIVGRKFLEVVVPKCERVTRIGRTVLVDIEDAERVVRVLAIDDGETAEELVDDCERQPETVDQVLAALGMERTGSASR